MYRLLVWTGALCAQVAWAGPGALPDSLRGSEMVFVPRGEGGYYIDKYEVTQADFAAFLAARGNQRQGGVPWIGLGSRYVHIREEDGAYAVADSFARHPVVEVSWHGARAFCAWAGKRLPTEEEWLYACRGPQAFKYPWGEAYEPGRANIYGAGDGYARTAPVGSFPAGASPFGAMDMAGNVWEWTWSAGDLQFLRGGSWVNGPTLAQCDKRVNTRDKHSYVKGNTLGFRCAR